MSVFALIMAYQVKNTPQYVAASTDATAMTVADGDTTLKKIVKSEAEWKKQLDNMVNKKNRKSQI